MGKYTIETDCNTADAIGGYLGIRIEICNKRTLVKTDIELTPYTEPDLDAIRNEAYEKGVQDTKQHWVDAPRSCAYKLGYENGLNDLWEAMQKAIKMYCEIDNEVFLRVFCDAKCDWGESVLQALFKNTPQHLIDSIREYEGRKTKVEYNFEEVKDVIETTAKEYNMSLDEIAAVLQKMRGANED